MLKVKEFINIIIESELEKEDLNEIVELFGSIDKYAEHYYNYLAKNLCFMDNNNHLSHDEEEIDARFIREREIPLNDDDIIYGDHLVYHYCSHDDTTLIFSLDSLEEVEEKMTNGAGLGNPFTTSMITIVNGKSKKYIYDEKQNIIIWER